MEISGASPLLIIDRAWLRPWGVFVYISHSLFQSPLPTLTDNLNRPLLVQRDPTCVQNGSRRDRILQRGQRPRIKLVEGYPALVDSSDCVDELLEADISVACLAGEVACFVRGVAHVEAEIVSMLT